IDDERILYQNARLCPAIGEPHCEVVGDINERVFKVLGSGGVVITDVSPAYRETFGPDEILMPQSLAEYRDMAYEVLEDDAMNAEYRKRGHHAVFTRHTYRHRALQILERLGVRASAERGSPGG